MTTCPKEFAMLPEQLPLRCEAVEAEPVVSSQLMAIVERSGGDLRRFNSRLKEVDEAAAGIRDSLRYTVVLPDENYWQRGTQIGEALVGLSDADFALAEAAVFSAKLEGLEAILTDCGQDSLHR